MKKICVIVMLLLALCMMFLLVGCDKETPAPTPGTEAGTPSAPSNPGASDDPSTPSNPSTPSDPGASDDPNPPADQEMTGVSFTGATYVYDGSEKELLVEGAPAGATIQYTNNKGVDAGTYQASAVISCEGYVTKTLTATLKINQAEYGNPLSFTGNSFGYDGQKHTIAVSGNIPQGATVTYTGGEDGKNGATNSGTYTIKVTVTHKNYKTFTATATLKINKVAYSSTLSFADGSFEYDTQKHTITVTGNVPVGATVTYTGGEDGKNGATNPGTYTITVTVSHPNYTTFTASATLKITSKVDPLSVAFFGNKIFFQNSLDKDHMYAFDGSALAKISRDQPISMITVGSKMYYISKGLLSSGICSFDPSTGKSTCLYEVSAEILVSDGTYLYYSVNSLLKSENNGIYRVSITALEDSSAEVVPVRLTTAKTTSMVVTDGYVYFSNKDDGGKLYAISANANNGTPKKIYDYKVTELITDGEKVYFVRPMTLQNISVVGSAIYAINVDGGLYTLQGDDSDKVIRITASNGKYLTIIGDYLYFLNTDLATTNIYGDGIYRAKKDGSGWISGALAHLSGSALVVDGVEDNIFGLTGDGEALYYFRTSTRHLYRFDLDEEEETDLMEDFEPPVYKEAILSYYEKAQEVNGSIYYINMLDGGKLYRYDIATRLDVRITQLAVADFLVHENVLYYATTRFLVNFDLYRMSLTTGEPECISTQKCMNFSVHDGKLYYTNYSSKNTLNCMDLTTLEDTVIFEEKSVSAGETVIYDGYIYFVANDQLYRYSLTAKTAALVNKNLKPLEYLIHNGKILMMNTDGATNSVGVYDIATDTYHKIDGLGLSGISQDVRGLFVYNGEMYYYRNIAAGTSDKGLYKVTYTGGEYGAVLVDAFDGYYLCESMVVGNKVYFLDVWQVKDSVPTISSTAKLCVLDMSTKSITVLN